MFVCESVIRVRYNETGSLGLAHHSSYYNWFDIVQEEFLRQNGFSYKTLEEKGLFFPPLETCCQFFHPVHSFDEITVKMGLKDMGEVKATFIFEVYRNEDKKLAARAESKQAFVSSSLRPVPLKKALPELYTLLKNALKEE
jgi:acyl-CoA thioester hydrolase